MSDIAGVRVLARWPALLVAVATGCAPAPRHEADRGPGRPPPAVVATAGTTDSAAPSESSVPPTSAAATGPELVARYACDEKDESGQCIPKSSAFRDWLAAIDPSTGDLLHLDGAGPGGAAWNPAAALVVLARAPTRVLRIGATRLEPGGE
jgi:hypothetical protein